MNRKEIYDKIQVMSFNRKKRHITQETVSKMTGVSRSNISNFERGIVNNMYLYEFYLNNFGGSGNEKAQNR